MRQVQVTAGTASYPILIEPGLLAGIGSRLSPFAGKKAAIVADEHTHKLFGERVKASLAAADIDASLITVPPGEASKSHAQLLRLYDAFLDMHLTRQDVLLALGGGVVGDLAGFAAATYLRGVPFVQIPTSLLAMVDSSVGGKVAVNLPRGKNLVGSFLQPELVLIDPEALSSLPPREQRAGLAEVIKYGIILDAALFDAIERAGSWDTLAPSLPGIIARCCELKAEVVAEDPLDHGRRMILNFGHTLGHAIEQHSSYAMLHGEAVAIGMAAMASLGESLAFTHAGTAARLHGVLQQYDLPTHYDDATPEALVSLMSLDKKATGAHIRAVLVRQVGECALHPLDAAQLYELAEAAR